MLPECVRGSGGDTAMVSECESPWSLLHCQHTHLHAQPGIYIHTYYCNHTHTYELMYAPLYKVHYTDVHHPGDGMKNFAGS